MKTVHTRMLLVVVLLTPPTFMGGLYVMVRRAESAGEALWEGIDPASLVNPNTPAALDRGGKIFRQSCAHCHGKEGEGGLGKPLNDPGLTGPSGFDHIIRTAYYGIPDTHMTSWKRSLGPADMTAVAAYIQHMASSESAE
jgi:mono/diheme cytochrome c family protein